MILVFAIAAGAAAAASAGLVVMPHEDPPGTPFHHAAHVVAAYRLPLFLDAPHVRLDQGDVVVTAGSLFDAAATIVLASLALLWPTLPRPNLRVLALVPCPSIGEALWTSPQPTGPPRIALHT